MRTQERMALITEIAKKKPNIGKTGMMKFLYLLQTLYGLPLDYDFEIYTYGPYCQTVMSDIEYAEFVECIHISTVNYSNEMSGYQICANTDNDRNLEELKEIRSLYGNEIDGVVQAFGEKSAKELELYSTIVYVSRSYHDNGWESSREEICNAVRRIKPHFTYETILEAYHDLDAQHFLHF